MVELNELMKTEMIYSWVTRSVIVPLALGSAIIFTSGCSEYWWTRGQPPSVAQLLERSQSKLANARSKRGSQRPTVSAVSEEIETALSDSIAAADSRGASRQLAQSLQRAQEGFVKLEGRISVGSRAPLSELSGQIRELADSARRDGSVSAKTLGLFAARTYTFLANELSVPAPSV